ncbi:MAG: DUF2141 domain-containing protein [Flaviramulus sp.]|jgi:uncharacterized protein (DUF2141 family)|nr:DUF2141 domain-containing protein [Flaviramulus sp.]
MQNLIKIFCITILSICSSFAQEEIINDIEVVITNLSSNSGKVFVSLYNSESSFLSKGIKATYTKIENNNCKVTFKDVPFGVYAISLFHDENGNNIMDSNFLGIPKEAYGCSNNARGFMGPPKWEDAKFQVTNSTVKQIIKL